MARIVVELTNRCNLKCQHCFSGRHGGRDDLPLAVLEMVLGEARAYGFDEISFTGGDPTVYPHFIEATRLTDEAGYNFGFVTNGQNFPTIYSELLPYRERLRMITFSMDGASESTYERLRGRGAFRKVMQAISVCVAEGLPFTLNMVVTAHNRHEIEKMAELATKLGSHGLRFGHLMLSRLTTAQGFDLSPWERKVVEAEIWHLRSRYPIAIGMAPGFHTTDLFPCAPLRMQEVNIDCHGRLTTCCHLSSHGDGAGEGDVAGNLNQMSFGKAYRQLQEENAHFRQVKAQHLTAGSFTDSDFFPCWYCSLYYRKVDWLQQLPNHAWTPLQWKQYGAEAEAESITARTRIPLKLYEENT
jgi:MoaA/NifB/PqqE/SkfB family radical SAM enzyme